MALPSLLFTLTVLSFVKTAWPIFNFSSAAPLLLSAVIQYSLVELTPALQTHALKCATVGVFLQAVASAAVFLVLVSTLLTVVVLLLWSTLIQPNEYDFLIAAFQNGVRNILALRGSLPAEMLMSVVFSLVSSVIHAFAALALTAGYASLVVTTGAGRQGGIAVRAVRVEDVLRYGWTGAVGMQTTKAIVYASIGLRRMFFWPTGEMLDPVFELATVGVWQTWISLAVAKRDLCGRGNAIGSVLTVCILKSGLDFMSILGLRGRNWAIASSITGVGQVGSIALLCWRRYQWCRCKLR